MQAQIYLKEVKCNNVFTRYINKYIMRFLICQVKYNNYLFSLKLSK